MEQLDPRIFVGPFMGKKAYLAPTSPNAIRKIQELTAELQDLSGYINEYREKVEKVQDDDRLKQATKNKRIKKLNEELDEKSEQYKHDIVSYRKKICDVMVDEWAGDEPSDQWYESDDFDDWMLFRVAGFFLRPTTTELSEKKAALNGSLS